MKQRFVVVVLVVMALLAVSLSAGVVLAQTGTTGATGATTSPMATGAAATSSTAGTYTLAAGQSATFQANFWCLDFSKPFPTNVTGPTGPAPQNVLKVLSVISNQSGMGTGASTGSAVATSTATAGTGSMTAAGTSYDPYQIQLAVWYAADGTWHDTGNTGHAQAQQIVTDSQNVTLPTGSDLSQSGLKVTVQSFTAVPDKNGVPTYHGTGSVMVQNTGSQSLTFVTDGGVFTPTDANAQRLVAQLAGPAQAAATSTVEPTTAATTAATATTAPTMAATTAPAAVATSTVAPLATATATETSMPTATAIATSMPTATSVTATATTVAEATPSTLPVTGAGDANGWMLALLVFGALILFAGFGLGIKRAQH